jgi:hypothetical protein
MRTITTILALAVGCVSAIAIGSAAPVRAQYYYPPPPGYGGYGGPDPHGCPPGYSLQGGNCAPYQGPVGGGGWRTYNGCPPGYTIQGGACQPYRGPVGPGYGYYRRH